jgi:hypothetical protein
MRTILSGAGRLGAILRRYERARWAPPSVAGYASQTSSHQYRDDSGGMSSPADAEVEAVREPRLGPDLVARRVRVEP